MKHSELLSKVEEMLKAGFTKSEIFSELGGTDDNAKILASTPTLAQREKFKTKNQILVFIIFYFAAVKFAFSCYAFLSINAPIYLLPITLFVPACAIALGIAIKKFRGYLYLPVGLLGFVVIARSIDVQVANFNFSVWAIWFAINLPVAYGVFLAFHLKKNLCPDWGFMGAKTNESGQYLFLQNQANPRVNSD